MSVINKMLRDLDHRANPSATVLPGPAALRQGTASVGKGALGVQQPAGRTARIGAALGLLAVAAAALGGWWWWSQFADAPPVAAKVASAPPIAVAAPVVAASAAPNAAMGVAVGAAIGASSPMAAAPPASASSGEGVSEPSVASMILRMESSLSARKAIDALLAAPAPAAVAIPPVATAAPATVAAPAPLPAAPTERANTRTATSRTSTAAASNPSGDSTPILQRQQQAGGDALAQAQTLWSNGSRDAAMDLMQQSIAAAERGAKAGAQGTTGAAMLLPLVREMARMQLAEARFGAVWEMLTRLEPLLGNPPDLWAIRANAAQRLGRHQDSVHAYMMALQSRPDEQRWLLGTAVSLAALGKTTSAAEMADKARAVGPISKEILAYLRQTGVLIREQ
ncbi:MAG: hypothetical protein V4627_19485 [Pseudomonadota bacterium]